MGLTRLAINRPLAMLMFICALVIVGFVSVTYMKVDRLPNISFPFVSVSVNYPGASPSDVEQLVTKVDRRRHGRHRRRANHHLELERGARPDQPPARRGRRRQPGRDRRPAQRRPPDRAPADRHPAADRQPRRPERLPDHEHGAERQAPARPDLRHRRQPGPAEAPVGARRGRRRRDRRHPARDPGPARLQQARVVRHLIAQVTTALQRENVAPAGRHHPAGPPEHHDPLDGRPADRRRHRQRPDHDRHGPADPRARRRRPSSTPPRPDPATSASTARTRSASRSPSSRTRTRSRSPTTSRRRSRELSRSLPADVKLDDHQRHVGLHPRLARRRAVRPARSRSS